VEFLYNGHFNINLHMIHTLLCSVLYNYLVHFDGTQCQDCLYIKCAVFESAVLENAMYFVAIQP